MRNFNISRVSDLELISNQSNNRRDLTFHFFGQSVDGERIREAIDRLVERGRIGNLTLVANYHRFHENAPFKILVRLLYIFFLHLFNFLEYFLKRNLFNPEYRI